MFEGIHERKSTFAYDVHIHYDTLEIYGSLWQMANMLENRYLS